MGILNEARARLPQQYLANGGSVNPAFDRVSYAYQPFSTQSYTARPASYQGFSQPVSSNYNNNVTAPLYSAPVSISHIPQLLPQTSPASAPSVSTPSASISSAAAGPITSPSSSIITPPGSAPAAPSPAGVVAQPEVRDPSKRQVGETNAEWEERIKQNQPYHQAGYRSKHHYENRISEQPWQSFGAHSYTRTGFDKDGNIKTEYRKKEEAEYQPDVHEISRHNIQAEVERSGLLDDIDNLSTSEIRSKLIRSGVNSFDANRMVANVTKDRIAKKEAAEAARRKNSRGGSASYSRPGSEVGTFTPEPERSGSGGRTRFNPNDAPLAATPGALGPVPSWYSNIPGYIKPQQTSAPAPIMNLDAAGPFNKGGKIGYEGGGNIDYGDTATHPGAPRGTDQVPIWAEDGEFVMTREATDKYLPVLEKMNNDLPEIGTVESAMSQLDNLINKYAGGMA